MKDPVVSDMLLRAAEKMRVMDASLEHFRSVRQMEADAIRKASFAVDVGEKIEQYRRQFSLLAEPMESVFRAAGEGYHAFESMLRDFEDRQRMIEATLAPWWTEMSRSAASTMVAVSRLPLHDIGRAVQLADAARADITASFMASSDAYWRFNACLGRGLEGLPAFSPSTMRLPLTGYMQEVRFLGRISTADDAHAKTPADIGRGGRSLSARYANKTREVLGKIDPKLVVFWDDTERLASSESPTKGKHACANLRTVMHTVLGALAPPDEAIRLCGAHDDIQKAAGRKDGKGGRIKSQVRFIGGGDANPHTLAIEEQVGFLMSCLNEGDHGVESALRIRSRDIVELLSLTGNCVTSLYRINVLSRKARKKGKNP